MLDLQSQVDLSLRFFQDAVEVLPSVQRALHVESLEPLVLIEQLVQRLALQFEHLHVVGEVAFLLRVTHLIWVVRVVRSFNGRLMRLKLERRRNVEDDVEVAKPALFDQLGESDFHGFPSLLLVKAVENARSL